MTICNKVLICNVFNVAPRQVFGQEVSRGAAQSGGGGSAPYPTSIRNPCVTSVRTANRSPGSSPAFNAARISR